MRFVNNMEKCAAALSRNGLDDITNRLVHLYCSDSHRIDLAVIEGDCCYYVGVPPRRTQKVIWKENEQVR